MLLAANVWRSIAPTSLRSDIGADLRLSLAPRPSDAGRARDRVEQRRKGMDLVDRADLR